MTLSFSLSPFSVFLGKEGESVCNRKEGEISLFRPLCRVQREGRPGERKVRIIDFGLSAAAGNPSWVQTVQKEGSLPPLLPPAVVCFPSFFFLKEASALSRLDLESVPLEEAFWCCRFWPLEEEEEAFIAIPNGRERRERREKGEREERERTRD